MDSRDTWYMRGMLDIDLTEDLNLLLTAIGNENDDTSVAPDRIGPRYQNTGIPPFAGPLFGLPPGSNPFTALAAPKPPDPRESNTRFDNLSNNEAYGITAVFNWDLDRVTVKSITSYYDIDRTTHTDFDTAEIDFLTVQGGDYAEQVSQELQLISNGWDRWEWIAGFYYFTQDATRVTNVTPTYLDRLGGFYAGGDLEIDSYAVFGQATYKLSDAFSVTGGVRYTWDEKEGIDLYFVQAPFCAFWPVTDGRQPKGILVRTHR